MKRLLIASAAALALSASSGFAADLGVPYYKAPPPPPPPPTWTGFYAGAEFGGGWEWGQTTIVTQSSATPAFPVGSVLNPINLSGALGGLYAGYNYQFDHVVIGIDGDYTWAGLTGTGTDISPVNGDIASHSDRMNWVSTVTGRLGYTNGNWLFFGKGGWAWAGFNGVTTTRTPAGALVDTTIATPTRNGWTLGTGLEWAFARHWSAKLEYDYVNFGTASYAITEVGATGAVTFPIRSTVSYLNMVKAGVAFRF